MIVSSLRNNRAMFKQFDIAGVAFNWVAKGVLSALPMLH
jgi:hypothetical protein